MRLLLTRRSEGGSERQSAACWSFDRQGTLVQAVASEHIYMLFGKLRYVQFNLFKLSCFQVCAVECRIDPLRVFVENFDAMFRGLMKL